jgi:hypothetical protein
MNQKGFTPILLILIVVILVTLAGSGYFLYQNQKQPASVEIVPNDNQEATKSAETREWKIYRNELLGIIFQYPSSWELVPDNRSEGTHHGITSIKDANNRATEIGNIFYYDNPKKLNLDIFERERSEQDYSGQTVPVYLGDDDIEVAPNGVTYYFRKNGFCEPPKCHIYIVPGMSTAQDKIFMFVYFESQAEKQKEYFDNIMSTFRFFTTQTLEECISDKKEKFSKTKIAPGRIVVGFYVDMEQAKKVVERQGLEFNPPPSYSKFVVLKVPTGEEIEWSCKLESDPDIKYAEFDYAVSVGSQL